MAMIRFLKSLFHGKEAPPAERDARISPVGGQDSLSNELEEYERTACEPDAVATNQYYDLLGKFDRNKSLTDDEVLVYCEQSFPLIPAMVRHWKKRDGGEFVLTSIPAIERAVRIYTDRCDRDNLQRLKTLFKDIPDLASWIDDIDEAFEEIQGSEDRGRDADQLLQYVQYHPGVFQKDVDENFGWSPNYVSWLCRDLEKSGSLRRKKQGRYWVLFSTEPPPAEPT